MLLPYISLLLILIFLLNYTISYDIYKKISLYKRYIQNSYNLNKKGNNINIVNNKNTKLFSLRDLEAKPSDESISPAVFEEDLYGVLGVKPNATRGELRDSYWKIAALNHPDRNSSEEAIQIFRNASRAYQILGKNEKTRQLYDNQYKAQMYFNVLEEVGTEVMVPLARDVAMPLINMTVNSIGSFAIPFFRDAFESSSAVFQAAFNKNDKNYDDDEDDDDSLNIYDVVTRASAALEKKAYQKKLRLNREQLESVSKQLSDSTIQLEKAIKEDDEMLDQLRKLEVDEITYISKASQADSALTIATTNFNSASKTEALAELEFKEKASKFIELRNRKQEIDYELTSVVADVKRLEAELVVAKAKVENLQIEQLSVAVGVEREAKSNSRYEEDYQQALMFKTEREKEVEQAQVERDEYLTATTKISNMKTEIYNNMNRQKDFKAILEKKVTQLTQKKTVLEKVQNDIIDQWNQKKLSLLEESVVKSTRESDLEDKINAMEKKVIEMRRQIEEEKKKIEEEKKKID